ncbi:lipid-A-disaccharide synthase [Marinobacterium jannaschii]|uniref:lipid-A-disaccharide synthase n=1 Tax=Marinobacterium jannaschii TaxID=64970 RepID=UPI0004873504|nr:lipid-A-disaccharide synthase [Marinobacterium jannaschii]
MKAKVRVGIVAGEASGDILGAGLIRALQHRYPDTQFEFEGIAGELMQAAGCRSLYPLERLSVMGLVEVLGRLRELLKERRQLTDYFLADPPDLFVGIDAPDFTLKMEGWLKQAGIPTVHYVSPSVWAWKRKRIYKIKQTTDRLLALFPFEARYYQPTKQDVVFVGHPLADQIPETISFDGLESQLTPLHSEQTTIALLPGSRGSEIKYLARPFLDTARWLQQRLGHIRFLMPAANDKRYQQLKALIDADYQDLNISLVLKHSREVMALADAILIASGTATLEATLLKKPMVVAYKMSCLTYAIYSRMVKSPYVSLPNLLAGEALVPEILQQQVTPEVLGPEVLRCLEDHAHRQRLEVVFGRIHDELRQGASDRAADAVMGLLEKVN